MKNTKLTLIIFVASLFAGCHHALAPKLYDNVVIVVKTEKTVTNLSDKGDVKEVISLVQARLAEYTEDALFSQGDMKVIRQCQPRAMRIIQDVESISANSSWNVGKRGWSAWANKNTDIKVSISTTIEDCETGNRIQKFTYENNGSELLDVIRTLASWNVDVAYENQRAK